MASGYIYNKTQRWVYHAAHLHLGCDPFHIHPPCGEQGGLTGVNAGLPVGGVRMAGGSGRARGVSRIVRRFAKNLANMRIIVAIGRAMSIIVTPRGPQVLTCVDFHHQPVPLGCLLGGDMTSKFHCAVSKVRNKTINSTGTDI